MLFCFQFQYCTAVVQEFDFTVAESDKRIKMPNNTNLEREETSNKETHVVENTDIVESTRRVIEKKRESKE